MTITAIAKELNTSTMTIYRRLKKAGVNLEDLRDEKSREISPAGASVIASLFSSDEVAQAGEGAAQGLSVGGVELSAAVLQARLDGAEALIEHLTDERDQLREQVKQLTAALLAEQADRVQERQLLTVGSTEGTEAQPPARRLRWPWSRR